MERLLPSDRTAPGFARELVASRLSGHSRIDDVLLATSELVTNALRHGKTAGTALLSIRQMCRTIRIAVRQPSSVPTLQAGRSSGGDLGGRGLAIVDAVADRWGSGEQATWFEIDDE